MREESLDHIVSVTVRVASPMVRVWRAVTAPDELIQWYAPGCRWEIPELRIGATVRFFNSETEVQHAIIERCAPPTELALRWTPDRALPRTTLLNSYSLNEEEHGTSITIAQTGYVSVPEDQRASWIRADEGAFPAIAEALANHLRQAVFGSGRRTTS